MAAAIVLHEQGTRMTYTFEDLTRYHGPSSPGGLAIAFKALERALPLLEPDAPCERREIRVRTAFGGPGARDGFELATRAVSDDRYEVDAALRRPDLGPERERFVFHLAYRDRDATLALRDGFVTEEFARLAFARERTSQQDLRLDELKPELAARVLAAGAAEVFEVLDL